MQVYEQMSAQMQEDSKKFASVVFTESDTDNRANIVRNITVNFQFFP